MQARQHERHCLSDCFIDDHLVEMFPLCDFSWATSSNWLLPQLSRDPVIDHIGLRSHYLGNWKVQICCKSEVKRKQNALIFTFTHIRLLTYYLLTSYFSFWLLLNILWNSTLFYANRSKCYQCPAHWACDTCNQATLPSFDQICALTSVWSACHPAASLCYWTLTNELYSRCWVLNIAFVIDSITISSLSLGDSSPGDN